jgi:hypothetical protein
MDWIYPTKRQVRQKGKGYFFILTKWFLIQSNIVNGISSLCTTANSLIGQTINQGFPIIRKFDCPNQCGFTYIFDIPFGKVNRVCPFWKTHGSKLQDDNKYIATGHKIVIYLTDLRVQGGGHLDNLNLGVVVQSILSILTTDARFLEATKLNKARISIK